jgi:hemolysin III
MERCSINVISKQEIANTLTHGFAFILSLFGAYFLIEGSHENGNQMHIFSAYIYSISMCLTFLASTIYHFTTNRPLKHKMRCLDHASIYVMIAASYTPFFLVALENQGGPEMAVGIWLLAIIGVVYKILFFGRWSKASLMSYLVMGWLSLVLCAERILTLMPTWGIIWTAAAGFVYTSGIYFYVNDDRPYYHAIWHVLVIIGTGCLYMSVSQYILWT